MLKLTNDNIRRCKEDSEFLGQMIIDNENLIWHSIIKYIGPPDILAKRNNIEKDDLLQLGRVAFVNAINAFDIHYGTKFSTFAVISIVREINCFLRDFSSVIRPTRTAKELLVSVKNIEASLGYLPDIKDLAILVDADEDKIIKVLNLNSIMFLDDTFRSHYSELSYIDLVKSMVNVEIEALSNAHVEEILEFINENLTDFEKDVLKDILAGYTQTEIANKHKVNQMKINRVLKKVRSLYTLFNN